MRAIAGSAPGAWEIERICAVEFLLLFRRSPRYWSLVFSMYARTLASPSRARLLRSAYCLARHLDDVLDRDRGVAGDPADYAREFLAQARAGRFDRRTIVSCLGDYVSDRLKALTVPPADPWGDLIDLVECMLIDYTRVQHVAIWAAADLETHLARTFFDSLKVTMIIAGSSIRTDDLGPLVRAQSIFYTLRDLPVDLSRNLINVPSEVLAAEGPLPVCGQGVAARLDGHHARAWLDGELARGKDAIEQTSRLLRNGLDTRARWVIEPLLLDLRGIARRLEARGVPLPAAPA